MAMLILLLPLTTICVAVAGFYVWHRQLIRKRQFEVADAALSAFSRTEAALTYARNPARFVGEGTTRKRDNAELPARSELLDRLLIPVERLRQHNEAFGELERVAFAVEVHFGDDVARHIREPLRAYNRIIGTTACRMGLVGMSRPERASHKLLRKLEAAVYSGDKPGGRRQADYDDAGRLSDEISKAKVEVEVALRPYLEAPTLEQFFLLPELRASARRGIACLKSLGHRPRTLT
jgi:hypothetical protein